MIATMRSAGDRSLRADSGERHAERERCGRKISCKSLHDIFSNIWIAQRRLATIREEITAARRSDYDSSKSMLIDRSFITSNLADDPIESTTMLPLLLGTQLRSLREKARPRMRLAPQQHLAKPLLNKKPRPASAVAGEMKKPRSEGTRASQTVENYAAYSGRTLSGSQSGKCCYAELSVASLRPTPLIHAECPTLVK
jgi:hypothetical protein